MILEINPRDNGACPLCKAFKACNIQRKLVENVSTLKPVNGDNEMEIVIYSCPFFEEKANQ